MKALMILLLLCSGCASTLRNATLSGQCAPEPSTGCNRYAPSSDARQVCERELQATYLRATAP